MQLAADIGAAREIPWRVMWFYIAKDWGGGGGGGGVITCVLHNAVIMCF